MPRSGYSQDRNVSDDNAGHSPERHQGSSHAEADGKRGSRRQDHSHRSQRQRSGELEDAQRHRPHGNRHSEHHSYRDHDSRDRNGQRQRSRSPKRSHCDRHSQSPPLKRRKNPFDRPRSPVQRSRAALPSQHESFRGEIGVNGPEAAPIVKEKPNYKPTGLLAREANTVAGTTTVLKYHEPPEARKPPAKELWRMYVFKQKDLVDTVYVHQRSVWLVGRDKLVTDLLLEHPSISKQHAVIQFRHINSSNEYGDRMSKVKPYLLDLESANGTKLNGRPVEASRYVELVDADVVKFGDSEREYVLMLPPPE